MSSPVQNSRNCTKKKKNNEKAKYFELVVAYGNDLQKVNNTNMIARMLLILLENFVNISHRGKKLGFLKHFCPI